MLSFVGVPAIRAAAGEWAVLAAQNLGMPGEYLGPAKEVPGESYFATAIVRPGRE